MGESIIGTILYSSSFYFIYVELFISLVMNFNRASIIFLRNRYQNFWKTFLIPMMVFFFVLSELFVVSHWFSAVTLRPINVKDSELGFDWNATFLFPWLKNSLTMFVVVIIVAVGSLISNIYVISYLILSNGKRQNFSEKGNNQAQKRLFIFTTLSFFIHVAFAILQVIFFNFPALRDL